MHKQSCETGENEDLQQKSGISSGETGSMRQACPEVTLHISPSEQVGEMKTNKIRLHELGSIMIQIRLCSPHIHSPCICMLRPIE